MNIKSYITAKNISFFVLVIFLIYLMVKMTDVFLLMFASYVIACAINPAVDKLEKKMPRSIAVGLMITVITLVTLGLIIPIGVLAFKEIKEFIVQLPAQISHLQEYWSSLKIANHSVASVFGFDKTIANSSVLAKGIIDNSINFTVSIIGALTIIITLGIIVFFFSNDRDKIQNTMLALFPPTIRDNAKKTMNELETKVGGYVTAQVLSIMQVGIVTAAGLMILRVEYAIFLGLIAAIMDLVPIVGPIVTFGLIILVSYPKGLLICILSCLVLIIAQTIENNWAKPYFFSKYMDMHPLIVIFSFLVAAKFLGVIGVILAPAIAAVIVALFKEIYIKPMNEEDVNE